MTSTDLLAIRQSDVTRAAPNADLVASVFHSNFEATQWKPRIDHLRQELSKLSDIRNSPAKLTLISELHYALLGAGSYEQVINELLSREDGSVKATYQAVVLSAWIDNLSLYNQALRSLL